jgi:hypothetical protein
MDLESDTSASDLWDPYVGLKPSEMDGCTLDANVEMEDELLPGGEKKMNVAIVELIIQLEGCNKWDEEWLPPKEKRKVMARKTITLQAGHKVVWRRCDKVPQGRIGERQGTEVLLHDRGDTGSSPHPSVVALGCLDKEDERGNGQGCYLSWLSPRLSMDATT